MRYFVDLSYKGSNFHGWQIQPNAVTVQEVLQDAFSLMLKEKINLTGAGRTDTGVHAQSFTAHFDYFEKIDDPEKLLFKLNSFLSEDISIKRIYCVKPEMHARFSAVSRTYEYRTHFIKDPFLTDFSYLLYNSVSFEKMNKAASVLFDYEDFTSFSKLHTDTKTNNCKIIRAEWIKRDEQNIFIIQADRFLRNMVRAITGTLLEAGQGKITCEDFRKIIESKDRSNAGVSMPAHGLFLTGIKYPEDIKIGL